MLVLKVEPHMERGGYHLDRFDAWLDGELIITSRQPAYAGARELLNRGWHESRHMCIEHPNGTRSMFGSVGQNAKSTVGESDQAGIKRRVWQPFNRSWVSE